jgi:hypothetical protein
MVWISRGIKIENSGPQVSEGKEAVEVELTRQFVPNFLS